MAGLQPRFEKGVGTILGGEFLVSEQCIDCDLCRQIAPDIFKRRMTGGAGLSYVTRQPVSDRERQRADEARDACPVGAIQLGLPRNVLAKAA